jgi:predicted alpha-1,2-mannosidase
MLAFLAACTGGSKEIGSAPSDAGVDAPPDVEVVDAGADAELETTTRIDPYIGSGGFGFSQGTAFLGVTAPHGLCKVGPDTNDVYSGYWYRDDTIKGFSHMHMHGTGATDYGVLALLPIAAFDPARRTTQANSSHFDKASESVSAGSYTVTLDATGVKVELTAKTHSAYHRYTFPSGSERTVLFDLGHHLSGGEVLDEHITLDPGSQRIVGRLHSNGGMSGGFGGYDVYFEARTRSAWTAQKVWSKDAAPADGTSAEGLEVGAVLSFDPGDDAIELQLGISLVSAEGARANLEAELGRPDATGKEKSLDWGFDAERDALESEWAALCDRVEVEGGTLEERTMLRTAMYHAFFMPSQLSDVDGKYPGPDKAIHTAHVLSWDGDRPIHARAFTDLSLWDTYRTLNPLYHLVAPESGRDVVLSLHEFAIQGGFYPKWTVAGGDSGTMIGASAEPVIADAYVKGVMKDVRFQDGSDQAEPTPWDAEDAYRRMRAAAMDVESPPGGRGGRSDVEPYMALGYVPSGKRGPVSQTTEFGNDDFALSQMAAALGHDEDAAALLSRAKSYRNLFDPAIPCSPQPSAADQEGVCGEVLARQDRGAGMRCGILRGKNADGSFSSVTSAGDKFTDDYVEATGFQSTWMAAHDPEGLAALYGGPEKAAETLEVFFQRSEEEYACISRSNDIEWGKRRNFYWASNEPDIHAPYLFSQIGRPDLAQKWARWAADAAYDASPDGLPGNDDGGTMSAWLVFNYLGIYPLAGSDRYIVAAPRFPRAKVKLPGGNELVIVADGVSRERSYASRVYWNDSPLERPEIRHGDLAKGGTLRFEMQSQPGTWGK